MMQRTMTYILGLLFALGGFAAITPTALAQDDDVKVDDPTGDVAPAAGWGDEAVPAEAGNVLPTDVAGPADLTGFRVFEETPTHLNFEMSVADFAKPDTWQPAQVLHTLCFTWSGTGAVYRFAVIFTYENVGTEVTATPELGGAWFERMPGGECMPHVYDGALTWSPVTRLGPYAWVLDVDLEAGLIDIRLPRALFERLNSESVETGQLDPRPAAGETLGGIQAHAFAKAFNGFTYYDTTATDDFTFLMDTGNDRVKVKVPSSMSAGYGVGGYDTPLYGVEVGSYQTVPVTIENYLDVPIQPNITATILTAGDTSAWEVRTLPSIPVPAMKDETPGSATVTMIVNSDDSISHKQAIRVIVEALDPEQPHLGAQVVDIVGVVPPAVSSSTVYFHRNGNVCDPKGKWINTLSTDSSAPAAELAFHTCDRDGDRTFTNDAGYTFAPDVPLERNYVLSTTANAKATLQLRSVVEVPGSGDQPEVPVPMVADLLVQILEGNTVVGEQTLENLQIGSDYSTVTTEIPILGRILGGFGREISDDKGLRIRVWLSAQDRTFEYGGCVNDLPCVPEDEYNAMALSGKVFMSLSGNSKIELPIISSERAGEVYNITASGALISLRLPEGEEKLRYTNPGRIVVYNVTVRNEGVNVDTANVKAVIEEGWKAEILPSTSYKLKVGEPRSFNVRVTAPADAMEGDTLRLDVIATSKVDPEAKATLPLTVEVTTGEQFEDQEIDPNLKADIKEESPMPPVVAFLALVALFGAVLRRRRA